MMGFIFLMALGSKPQWFKNSFINDSGICVVNWDSQFGYELCNLFFVSHLFPTYWEVYKELQINILAEN